MFDYCEIKEGNCLNCGIAEGVPFCGCVYGCNEIKQMLEDRFGCPKETGRYTNRYKKNKKKEIKESGELFKENENGKRNSK